MKTNKQKTDPRSLLRHSTVALGVAAVCAAAAPAHAFKLDTGNPDIEGALDTSLRYSAAQRTSSRDLRLVSAATDESNFQADKGELVLSRFDIFSELELSYRDTYGIRASAAAWYDGHFSSKSKSDPRFAAASLPNYPNNDYTDVVMRYYRGPSAEMSDAFAWGNFELGSTQLALKAGRFAWLPGEFLIGNGNSLSYSMAPSDGRKGSLSPGASAKETALPIGQIGATLQVNPEWTVMGQYTYEFRKSRVAEGGTFFSTSAADVGLEGPPFVNNPVAPSGVNPRIPRVAAIDGEKGDISIGTKWQPDWANGDGFGLWYRRFDDKNPSWMNQNQASATGFTSRAVFARNIDLVGVSYNTVLAGWSTGAELNVRKNMPLAQASVTFGSLGGSLINDPTFQGPRGKTIHGLVSAVRTINKNMFFDSGSFVAQLDFMRLQSISSGAALFNGVMSGVAGRCPNEEVLRGCATRNALNIAINFTPTWQQVFPSVDISAPMTALYGVKGVAAANNTSMLPEKSYVLKPGVRAEYYYGQYKHQFDLSFTAFGGPQGLLPGATTPTNAGNANFRDRHYVNFTYQTGF